jgi:Xaa-Pro aminopeptidase
MINNFTIPAHEINTRITKVQQKLQQWDINGLLIIQRMDLFYFAGTAQNGALYVPADGDPILFILKYMPRAIIESPLKNIIEIKSIKEIPGLILDFFKEFPNILGLEFDVLPVKDFHFYQSFLSAQEYVDGSPLIMETRMIKSDWEIDQMDHTAELSRKTFEYMCSEIGPGMTEMEFAGICETSARKMGHGAGLRNRHYQAEGYPWHILSGQSGGMVGLLDAPTSGMGTSPAFPCGAGSKRLAANEPIMIDFGTVLNGYHIDETRMFAIDSMPDKALEACNTAIEIHNMILEKAKPGVTLGDLFQMAVAKADSLGYAEQFLGPPGYKVTFIGHGIGLELVEQPIIAKNRDIPLEPGMTFALEPKMVFENEFSAGIESVFQVTKTGSRLISKVPVEVFIC